MDANLHTFTLFKVIFVYMAHMVNCGCMLSLQEKSVHKHEHKISLYSGSRVVAMTVCYTYVVKPHHG